jgi:hypothetical protein
MLLHIVWLPLKLNQQYKLTSPLCREGKRTDGQKAPAKQRGILVYCNKRAGSEEQRCAYRWQWAQVERHIVHMSMGSIRDIRM